METNDTIVISKEDLFQPEVDEALLHQQALIRQSEPVSAPEVSWLRQILFSNLFYLPLSSFLGAVIGWGLVEPWLNDRDFLERPNETALLFTLGILIIPPIIVISIFIGDALIRSTFLINLKKAIIRAAITVGLTFVAFAIIGLIMTPFELIFMPDTIPDSIVLFPPGLFLVLVARRSLLWVIFGLAIGLGLYLGQGTRAQLSNAMLGGAVGGALGGLFFDPIDRFLLGGVDEAYISRMVGFTAVGLCVGIFIALGEQLSRDGWFKVKTGPLAGKSFILYRETTSIGSTPHADIYLFKDREIDPKHVTVYRVGGHYEVEDAGSRYGTKVNGITVRRRRLESGDQITLGATILEFEERAKRTTSHQLISEEA